MGDKIDTKWDKFKEGLLNNLGFMMTVIAIAVYMARNFVTIANTGKTIAEIIADGLFALFFSWTIRTLLGYQGILSGMKNKRMLKTLQDHGAVVAKMEPYSPLLESFCEMKNAENRIKRRRRILSKKHLEYEDVFNEEPAKINEIIKKRMAAIEAGENTIDLCDVASSRRKRTLKKRMRQERKEIYKCIKQANDISLSELTEDSLTTDGGNSDDPYKFSTPLGKWIARRSSASLPVSMAFAVVLGYYGYEFIKDPSIATVIGGLVQVCIFLMYGAWQFLVSYIHTIDTYRKSVVQKINILNEFVVLAEKQNGVKFVPPVEIIKVPKIEAPIELPKVTAAPKVEERTEPPTPAEVKEESIAVEDPFAETPIDNKDNKEVIAYGEQNEPIQLGQPAELLGD